MPLRLFLEASAPHKSNHYDPRRMAGGRACHGRIDALHARQAADKIIVVENGAVVEEGSHEALPSRGGVYAGLHQAQAESDIGRSVVKEAVWHASSS